MDMPRRILFLCAALIGAVAVPATSANQASAPIPDFSGNWAHPFLTGFEPPVSGPGPVLNTSRRPDGIANFQQLVGDHTNPILKPHAAEIVKRHGEQSRAGIGYPTPSNQCRPQGVPYIFWDFTMQMLQRPDHITMTYRQGNEVRRIRMNEPHPKVVKPSWYGDSVGRYEGDTLVIDTVGVKVDRYAMLDMYGTPFSEKLHVIERYRLVDYDEAKDEIDRNFKENSNPMGNGAEFDKNYRGKMLQLHFTVEDEETFTTPWTATITYWPNLVSWPEQICAENRREYYNNKDTDLPVAGKPDF
jgi:hypothetical protein